MDTSTIRQDGIAIKEGYTEHPYSYTFDRLLHRIETSAGRFDISKFPSSV